jgi:hypothetical protein
MFRSSGRGFPGPPVNRAACRWMPGPEGDRPGPQSCSRRTFSGTSRAWAARLSFATEARGSRPSSPPPRVRGHVLDDLGGTPQAHDVLCRRGADPRQRPASREVTSSPSTGSRVRTEERPGAFHHRGCRIFIPAFRPTAGPGSTYTWSHVAGNSGTAERVQPRGHRRKLDPGPHPGAPPGP